MSALFALCLISVPPKIIIIIFFFFVGVGGVSFKQHELKKKNPSPPRFHGYVSDRLRGCVGVGWPDADVKYGGTFASELMSQERGSYLRNWSQSVASMAFWFKKKVAIGQQGTEKI